MQVNVKMQEKRKFIDSDLVETFKGLVKIDKTENQKYLWFTISSGGDNIVNINVMKNKSNWIIRKTSWG